MASAKEVATESPESFTGAHFAPGAGVANAYEHWLRYVFASRLAHDKEVLDVGCREGYGARYLASSARSVVAVDADETAIAQARRLHATSKLRLEHAPFTSFLQAFPAASVDLVTAFTVFEHATASDQQALLDGIRRALRPAGVALICAPAKLHAVKKTRGKAAARASYRDELEAALKARFPHVRLLEQTILTGCAIADKGTTDAKTVQAHWTDHVRDDAAGLNVPDVYESRFDEGLHATGDYIMAVVSAAPLPEILPTILVDFSRKLVTETLQFYSAHSDNLTRQAKVANRRVEDLQSELAEARAQASTAQALTRAAEQRTSAEAAARAQVVAKNEALQRELDETVRERNRLRSQLESVSLGLAQARYRETAESPSTLRIVAHTPQLLVRSPYWLVTGKLRSRVQQQRQMDMVRQSGLFDEPYYKATYPDVTGDALDHYFRHGAAEGRKPNAVFDSRYYLQTYPDVAAAGLNPLWHYLAHGVQESRNPAADFDTAYYLTTNPGIARSGLNPLVHYLRFGMREDVATAPGDARPAGARAPSGTAGPSAAKSPWPFRIAQAGWWLGTGRFSERRREQQIEQAISEAKLFDARFYLERYPDIAAAGVDPLRHFVRDGAAEGRSPHPLFDTQYYLAMNPDVAEAGINPLYHYLTDGAAEGRDPHPLFSSRYYAKTNPEVAAVGLNPLSHYVTVGAALGRDPHPLFDSSFYLAQNPDVALGELDPLSHYILHGAVSGCDPSPDFDTTFYLSKHDDVAALGMNPLIHYATTGRLEFRSTRRSRHATANQGTPETLQALMTSGLGAATHDESWGAYARLTTRIAQVRRTAIETYRPSTPDLCTVEEPLAEAARKLAFPRNSTPKVSIIIPVYNHLKATLECLASIIRHTGIADYEVIAIDDGSSDQTPTVLPTVQGLRFIRNDKNLGFLRTCNRAAKEAKGEFLVFLNNDAQVTSGWLEPLLEPFADPTIGAVGPKIIYPNGRLQEAGAMINTDLSIAMVGVGGDPAEGRYNYAREVHYCSGTCLAVKRATFERLGGFDDALAPAYYEDCDLQLRMRENGLRTLYNPASVVAHHLSLTHDGLPELGVTKKKQIVVNSQRMREKWARVVEDLNDLRLIALYLPQFHPFAENDLWWGKGFTEWTNVTKARPNFVGHYQPQLPVELGFYDLRVPEVMEHQARLARQHGIHGFCYYYYWFAGKRLLDLPLERQLETGKPDFPFCLSWANENWTRRWDGGEGQADILIAQKHSEDDDRAMFRDVARYMRRPNYIRIHGKPVFLIYRAGLLPDMAKTAAIWREVAREEGIGDIYLVRTDSFDYAISSEHPGKLGLDAAVEFVPHHRSAELDAPVQPINPDFSGAVWDYEKLVAQAPHYKDAAYTHFRCVMPGWDNTARRQGAATTFTKSSPGAYQAWLEETIRYTHEQNVGDERIIFVNAWNEWAEGAHLEPDRRFGRGFLEATRNALQNHRLSRLK